MNNNTSDLVPIMMKMIGYGSIPDTTDDILQAESALSQYPDHLKMFQKFRDLDTYPEMLKGMKIYLDQATVFTEFKNLFGCSEHSIV